MDCLTLKVQNKKILKPEPKNMSDIEDKGL